MKRLWWIVLLLATYVVSVFSLDQAMANRPIAIKLGYTPAGQVSRLAAGDLKPLLAEFNVLRVLVYFGSLVEQWKNRILIPAEYPNMFHTIKAAVQLDPYNMDAYYFAQAAFTWQVGHAADVNRLLDYGIKYRTWDWQLPYFAGFNAAYFLHDYDRAAEYMRQAAKLSGNTLLISLSARYFYESGQEDLGIVFLQDMIARSTDSQERNIYQMRLAALVAVKSINKAIQHYREDHGSMPPDLTVLAAGNYLSEIPSDPYGGEFYLDPRGMVRTTSQMVLSSSKKIDPKNE